MSIHQIGRLGEQFVGQCLQQNGWIVLHYRWRCRWGEIDIIAQAPEPSHYLIFVEVKVRSDRNWDNDGLLAITPRKREKLLSAAQMFLSHYPHLATYHCRFDVALVRYQKKTRGSGEDPQGLSLTTLQENSVLSLTTQPSVCSQIPDDAEGHLYLQHYIEDAFE